MERRRPKGYSGHNHETLGSDLLAVLQILKLPDQVLGKDEALKLHSVKADAWYPIEWLLELMDKLEREVGLVALTQLGRKLFKSTHEARVLEVAKSAHDIIYALDGMYHHANRGVGIGGWKVLKFEAGYAEVEKTTPHHCMMEQGILSAALSAVGCPATVAQTECFRAGAPACLFTMTSSITDGRWSVSSMPPKRSFSRD